LQQVVTRQATYGFAVTNDGHITYDSSLEGHFTGAGTTTLAMHGLPVTIDATRTGQADLSVAGVGTFLANRPLTLRLLPCSNNLRLHDNQQYWFQVDGSGHVDYDPGLDAVLSGRGTSTLTIR